MNRYDLFYRELFSDVVFSHGPLNPDTLTSVIGFTAGGPVSLCTVRSTPSAKYTTYVTCELAVRADQRPSPSVGRYELLLTCDDEEWSRRVLTEIADMSFTSTFKAGDTLDISPIVEPSDHLQAVAFETFSTRRIQRQQCGILRVHGLTRHELEQAKSSSVKAVLEAHRSRGTYPWTTVRGNDGPPPDSGDYAPDNEAST